MAANSGNLTIHMKIMNIFSYISFPLTKRFDSNTGLKFNDFDFKM